jgi:RNA recognition motif-containing protein
MKANTLYVQNLAWSTLTEDLQEAFRSCQGFKDAFVKLDRDGRPAGYGFVRFGSEETAAAAEAVREI